MAKFRARYGVDMTDMGSRLGTATYAAQDLLVVEAGLAQTYYFGDFRYPGGDWRGTNSKVFHYADGVEIWNATGLRLGTRYATAGETIEQAYRKAFSGDDTLIGSGVADALVGYAGADRIEGGAGGDVLHGKGGDDALLGGNGHDALRGGAGRDLLKGGRGDDTLQGGVDRDTFVFGARDGRDRIVDFADGVDRIKIVSGAERFRDLEIEQVGNDVRIALAYTVIELRGIDVDAIGSGDFLF